MKKKLTIIFLNFCFLFLGLTACNSQEEKEITGTYVSVYDKSDYLVFDKDGTFINSMWTITSNGNTTIQDCFEYTINDNGLIIAIDTTEYAGQNSFKEYEIGYLYEDYICSLWEGNLPKDYTDTTISYEFEFVDEEYIFTYTFKNDMTYEYTASSNEEILETKAGTYLIDKNTVTCTSENNNVITFINADNKSYCIEYTKEQ